ncbi:CMT1A duplicated region transcript 4 protein [Sminthopsis crassicaudata]|uniref:CMT1A duplicated region transcript 4 n=1 Tax=Sarcophilus harrisii TaxID=9305 RepID=A0A7N4PTR0_SARHA|nr:CMT1A duplicated region transcript 4 protein [Sarcophilus harrisii]XP_031824336.1 CMT1A duplicated region transcript 4 protein [Sarcophilus harrisii]XP_031824337.1 CMT1A duplicated region transcript 4 protein [Sarcophilus harrisii]XP_051851581.1 CMT1A duplicated region transcript 4 protein [Antechinus flavipes]XP_051851582.1 CMT1A duplicated region transcript 4 protein [Antechinus flavipes]XP_051851583.1 CMT1A duplicated region transcript 4 protein [Antechinus flavipes]
MRTDPENPRRKTLAPMDNHIRSSANIGLPLNLINQHASWPAYVTYTSPSVNRLIEQERLKQSEYYNFSQEDRGESNHNIQPGFIYLSRKPANFSADASYKEHPTTSVLESHSPLAAPLPDLHVNGAIPQTASRGDPTDACNKLIYSQKPMMRIFVYGALPDDTERKTNVH